MIGLVDYGMGNLCSVSNALEMAGGEVRLCKYPEDLGTVDRIILPGVGAFRNCISNLKQRGFLEALDGAVCRQGKPIWGICLGMQAMARKSFEGGEYKGLGWFDADIVRLQPGESSLRVPQIGWNDVRYLPDHRMFSGLPPAPDFYFVHSYHMKCDEENEVVATCDYGGTITVSVCKDNIFATQFHPEKSQDFGLRMLSNFLTWNP